ncbi:hypothetical protein L198_04891 [Cryptococcus wingfieldii CBS 7118]|uniref:Uncharacterized protein n=1 Tax=Cryptococcus wingfieldii CBS 7118 TaxID=1295528 RepID=A0A1E3J1K3_9TREE|nr:hypothetical protein L198_04891 [Cryptococcus wingfieldii CBS 7118]ODN94747.1 hypothetical protein L198_04891 [Cryptococcus wingfieldii CBS 7118]
MDHRSSNILPAASQKSTTPLAAVLDYHRASDTSVESTPAGGETLGVRARRSTESISSSISTQTTVPTSHRDTSRDPHSNRSSHSHRLSANDLPDELLKSLGLGDGQLDQSSGDSFSGISSAVDMTPSSAGIGSVSSTPAELSFGPQSVPFTLKRRELINEGTPSRPGTASSSYFQMRQDESYPVNICAVNSGSSTSTDQAAKTHPDKKSLSSWRRTQILTAKRPELAPDTKPQAIPTLYGPHSLPYARNPSGVDATAADETAYLTHVFGLRPATGGASETNTQQSARVASSGSDSSGTQSYRSTSTSSVYNNVIAARKKSRDARVFSGIETDETYLVKPSMARSSHQKTKSGPGMIGETRGGVVSFNFDTLPLGSPASQQDTDSVSDSANRAKNIVLPDQEGKRVVSESALLEPKLGTSILGPSKSFANLRDASRLSPIPGSPSGFNRTLNAASIRQAYRARIRSASMSRVQPSHLSTAAHPDDDTSSFATPIRIPAFVPIYFDPASGTYGVGISPEATTMPSSDDEPSRPTQAGLKIPHPQAPSAQISKADTSDNWRHKFRPTSTVRPKKLYTPVSSQPQTPSTGGFRNEAGFSSSEVMTIDKLFEKYSPQVSSETSAEGPKLSHTAVAPAPASAAAHHVLTNITNVEISKSSRDQRSKSPQGVLRHRLAPAASIVPKGTPGAGRLLKKSVKVKDEDDENSLPPVPRDAVAAVSEESG